MTHDDGLPKSATAATRALNAAARTACNFADDADFERASRGLLRQLDPPIILDPFATPLWDVGRFGFLHQPTVENPPEAHPSLWRQAQLNCMHGLFEVVDGIYQVRGYDLSNISFVRSDHGWIVIDPLTVAETSAAARQLVDAHFGSMPIVAIIYTHSHVDHYGGVRGLVTDEEVAKNAVEIIAPDGFLEAAISENVIAGAAMTRRAMYMYGVLLPVGPQGHIDAGLGKGVPIGSGGLIAPTRSITNDGDSITIDGVDIEFQLTPGTEAPAEMNFYFPQFRAVCMAENCAATLHNVYTPRGAEIRDALNWSKYIDDAIELFVDKADVAFASHHWPRWGHEDMLAFLGGQRDVYRYIHDETMRLANHGYTPLEIADMIEVPRAIADEWFNRDYYGTVNHNVKAVYQRYLGWFDANPAHLHELPPVDAAKKFVAYMGGADAVIARARTDYANGDYRWVAQVVNHVVFADPTNRDARLLQANALEQLGYQSESGPWRSFYLSGAQELRNGTPSIPGLRSAATVDVMRAMTPSMVLDNCAVKLNGPHASAHSLLIDVTFTDHNEARRVRIESGVLTHRSVRTDSDANTKPKSPRTPAESTRPTVVQTTVETLVRVTSDLLSIDDARSQALITIDGDAAALYTFVGLLDQFDMFFAIIEP